MDLSDVNVLKDLVANMSVSGDASAQGTQVGGTEWLKEGVPIHKFTSSLGSDATIFYQLTKLGSSSFLWIGGNDAKLNDLSLSSPTHYDKKSGMPTSTKIFGSHSSSESTSIAAKLAKKLNKPFYVSFNLQGCDIQTLQQIDIRIFEELNIHPEKF